MESISPTLCPLFLLTSLIPTKWTKASMQSGPPVREYPGPQLQHSGWLCLNRKWDYVGGASAASSLNPSAPIDFEGKIDQIPVPYCPASVLSGIERKQNGKTHHKQIL